MTDHYATLGVAKTATPEEIKRAYRKLASQHHPDRGGDTARFQTIQAAYNVLGDEAQRSAYDNPQPQFGNFSGFGPGHTHFNMNDIFGAMFGQQFGQRRPAPFVRMSLWIRLTDVITGGRRPVAVNTGSGSNTIEIDIPCGVEDGDSVQYPGLAPGGADLVVQFRVHPDPRWQRDGLNLIVDQDVSVWDMILGGDLVVRTMANTQISIRIPERCQPRTLLRVRGHGIPKQQGATGDLLIRVNPVIPQTIDPDLVAAIQKYRS